MGRKRVWEHLHAYTSYEGIRVELHVHVYTCACIKLSWNVTISASTRHLARGLIDGQLTACIIYNNNINYCKYFKIFKVVIPPRKNLQEVSVCGKCLNHTGICTPG